MSGKTEIQWTDLSWNPTSGCTRVSPGCQKCYAFALHDQRHAAYQKYHGVYPKTGIAMPKQYAHPFSTLQLLPERLNWPLTVKKPSKIFVNSMSDLFHSQVPDTYIRQVFETMKRAHWHTFQILTKRGNRLQKLADSLDWPPNVWMGVSIEHDLLSVRADQLRRVPASTRFLSCEPLLGPLSSLNLDGIHLVITGGESGPGARPLNPERCRDLRDRCLERHICFFHKQNGGRTPNAGGRLLDGRTWDQLPGTEGEI